MTTTLEQENNTQKWILIGCGSVVAVVICCALVVFGGLFWLGSQTTDGLAQITMDAPTSVALGGEYVITIEIRNISSETVTLESVDIQADILAGFIIETVDPYYFDTYEFGFGGETYQTYTFQFPIAPGDSLTVTFRGEAINPGTFGGEIDVCVNSDFNCKTDVIRTVVK